MNQWKQYYYTWSTKSLSQNKVGLGIVAASEKDRNSLLAAGQMASRCNVIRDEKQITVEQFCYDENTLGFVRMGATACEQGADQRNNAFVHLYAIKGEDLKPEEYLAPLEYKKSWDGCSVLSSYECEPLKTGRAAAISIIKELQLEERLPELIGCVYRCMLGGEKPMVISYPYLKPGAYAEFARKMMIVIHYLLPSSLRKEADYISFVNEETQDAKFLFGMQAGRFGFAMDEPKEREYGFLEKEFYEKLSRSFLKDSSSYERHVNKIEKVVRGLSDKRNLLEKCIYTLMVSSMAKEKREDSFYQAAEKLIYWASNEKELVPVLKEAMKNLDFHDLDVEELLSYTGILLTGTSGETKKMALEELGHIFSWCYEKKDGSFERLQKSVREKKKSAYVSLLEKNRETDFVHAILFAPCKTLKELKESYRYHNSFFPDFFYREHFVNESYNVYKKLKKETDLQAVEKMAWEADKEAFTALKLADVEQVFDQAGDVKSFVKVAKQMELSKMEEEIIEAVYERLLSFFTEQQELNREEENLYVEGASCLSKKTEMEAEIRSFYKKQYRKRYKTEEIHELIKRADRKADLSEMQKEESLLAFCDAYLKWTEKKEAIWPEPEEWILFMLAFSDELHRIDPEKAKKVIRATKQHVLRKEDTKYLHAVNRILKANGAPKIETVKNKEKKKSTFGNRIKNMGYRVLKDISLGSFWAFFLGFYGYLFISLREMRSFLTGYQISIGVLAFLLLCYLISQWKKETVMSQGMVCYVLGMGLFLMNLGLSLDVDMQVYLLYIISGVAALLLRILYPVFFRKEREMNREE